MAAPALNSDELPEPAAENPISEPVTEHEMPAPEMGEIDEAEEQVAEEAPRLAEQVARAVARQAEEREAFLPPAPQEAPRRQASQRSAAPFTAPPHAGHETSAFEPQRSIEAAGPQRAERSGSEGSRRRPFSLFAKATGLLPKSSDEDVVTDESPVRRSEPHFSEPEEAATRAGEEREASKPQQPSFAGMEPPSTANAKTEEEDLLDIPAFLRRQAN